MHIEALDGHQSAWRNTQHKAMPGLEQECLFPADPQPGPSSESGWIYCETGGIALEKLKLLVPAFRLPGRSIDRGVNVVGKELQETGGRKFKCTAFKAALCNPGHE